VIRGEILVIPIEESILYVQPLYLQAEWQYHRRGNHRPSPSPSTHFINPNGLSPWYD